MNVRQIGSHFRDGSRMARVQACAMLLLTAAPLVAQTAPTSPPPPPGTANDPVAAVTQSSSDPEVFRQLVSDAVARDASLAEARAAVAEAQADRTRARSALFPRADLQLTSNQRIADSFGNNIDTVVERSQSQRRTDAIVSISQLGFDFGATSARIDAAGARLRAAALGVDDAANTVALNTIAAWYDVFGYRALVALAQSAVERQRALRGDVGIRVQNGYLAEGDAARSDGYVASAESRVAVYTRQLANAEARFAQLTGKPAPATLGRAPFLGVPLASQDAASLAAAQMPAVRAAQEAAEGARQDARGASRDRYPQLGFTLGGGRYGFLEDLDDYSVQGRVTLRAAISPGFNATMRQYQARAGQAEARADRLLQDASRDAAIAWSDVKALDEASTALAASTAATRRSRDVLAERFRVSRGDLFELEVSEQNYFDTAANYLQTLTELDAARYVLLARTGRLLDTLQINTGSAAR